MQTANKSFRVANLMHTDQQQQEKQPGHGIHCYGD